MYIIAQKGFEGQRLNSSCSAKFSRSDVSFFASCAYNKEGDSAKKDRNSLKNISPTLLQVTELACCSFSLEV